MCPSASSRSDERGHIGRVVTVDDDRAVRRHVLVDEELGDLGRIDAAEPLAGERDRARDVAAARLALESPAVVGRGRAEIDDGEVRIAQAPGEVGGGDGG